ncbi:MAG: HD domain-containing protein, partial [Bdellovibrionales bacterium]
MARDKIVIEETRNYVRRELDGESSGHGWWHIHRVVTTALAIAREEKADETIVCLAALLHDIADYKIHGGDCDIGPKVARVWLERQGMDEERIRHVCKIIEDLSFKGAGTESPMETLEGKI